MADNSAQPCRVRPNGYIIWDYVLDCMYIYLQINGRVLTDAKIVLWKMFNGKTPSPKVSPLPSLSVLKGQVLTLA